MRIKYLMVYKDGLFHQDFLSIVDIQASHGIVHHPTLHVIILAISDGIIHYLVDAIDIISKIKIPRQVC